MWGTQIEKKNGEKKVKAFGFCKVRQRIAYGSSNIIHFKSPLKNCPLIFSILNSKEEQRQKPYTFNIFFIFINKIEKKDLW